MSDKSHLRLVPPPEPRWRCPACRQVYLLSEEIPEWEMPIIHDCPKGKP